MIHTTLPTAEATTASPTAGNLSRGGPVQPSTSALRPLNTDEVSIVGGFWGERQQLNADVILEHCQAWMERIGWIANFDHAADGTVAEHHSGIEFVDSEVYKLLEAMAWELGRRPDTELEGRFHTLVARVAAAQEADGYLHTSFGRPGQRPRYSDLEWGHELYCFGHLLQAAVARLRTGWDDELVAVARNLADHVYTEFGPTGRVAVCGHPEIEPALVEFSRATNEPRYLELARLFVARRGTGTLKTIEWGAEYFQDDLPVRRADVLRGHAVRALYLAAGALDVATEDHDEELAEAIKKQWKNTVARRTYITGGMGSHHQDEAFGADYELPPDRAYSETCAGIASVMLSWRLLLQTGEAKYADLIERTLLNNVLASPRQDGRGFFYTNTLHQRTMGVIPRENDINVRALATLRAPWFEVSCCPTNIARTLASAELYFATATDTALQIHQYGDLDIRTHLPGAGTLAVEVRTAYPLSGEITLTVTNAPPAPVGIALRVPVWAEGATLKLNGEEQLTTGEVFRKYLVGDTLSLSLPTSPRISHPHPHIDATRGAVAVEQGPLVLCLESTDLPDGYSVNDIQLSLQNPLEETGNGVFATVELTKQPNQPWPYTQKGGTPPALRTTARFIPYYSWGNRGAATMRVWLPTTESSTDRALPGKS